MATKNRKEKPKRELNTGDRIRRFFAAAMGLLILASAFYARAPDRSPQIRFDTDKLGTTVSYRSGGEEEQDYVLLLDCSGSTYAYAAHRNEAAKTFLESVPEHAYVAIKCFDCEVIRELSSDLLSVSNSRDELGEVISRVKDYDFTQRKSMNDTYMGNAMSEAIRILQQRPENAQKSIIMVSDGVPDSFYHGVDYSKRQVKLFKEAAKSAVNNGIRTYVIHTPGDDGKGKKSEKGLRLKSEEDIENLCSYLNTSPIDPYNEGVTASLTTWEEKELGKVVYIDDLNDLSAQLLNLCFSIQKYQVYSMRLGGEDAVGSFYLPSGVDSLMLYVESADRELSGKDPSFRLDKLRNTDRELDVRLSDPVSYTTYGKYYSVTSPGRGTFQVSLTGDAPCSVTVLAHFNFKLFFNVKEPVFSPYSKGELHFLVDGHEPEGLKIQLFRKVFNAEGELIATGAAKEGTPLQEMTLTDTDAGGSMLLWPEVRTNRGMKLPTDSKALRLTFGNDIPLISDIRCRRLLFYPFSDRVPLCRVQDIAMDTETSPEQLVFQTDSRSFQLAVEDGVLYCVYNTPFFSASVPFYVVDKNNQKSEVKMVMIDGFPVAAVAIILLLGFVAAWLIWKNVQERKRQAQLEEEQRLERERQRLERERQQLERENRIRGWAAEKEVMNSELWHGWVHLSEKTGKEKTSEEWDAIGSVPAMYWVPLDIEDIGAVGNVFKRRKGLFDLANTTVYATIPDNFDKIEAPYLKGVETRSALKELAEYITIQVGSHKNSMVLRVAYTKDLKLSLKRKGMSEAFAGSFFPEEEEKQEKWYKLSEGKGTLEVSAEPPNGPEREFAVTIYRDRDEVQCLADLNS